jgi:hypothetical protein
MPPGLEDLKTYEDIVHAIAAIKAMYPDLKKAILKLNDGFSGDGNAVLRYPQHLTSKELLDWVTHNLYEKINPIAKDMSIEMYLEKFQEMGGIAEAFLEGDTKASPSVQCRITPLGEVEIISTHDQVLGGESGQQFIGALFPCNENYRTEITELAKTIAEELMIKGVLGRFSIDFVSVKENDQWKHFAIEINLRKGGTTHPYLMLQFLTNGHYNEEAGLFESQNREHRYYFASDNMQNDAYKGLTPQDLIDIAMFHGLQYDSAAQKGVMFHMIGALSQFGKMGIICIGGSREEAYSYYKKTIEVLDAETVAI